jgi:hypothetical protein
MAKLGQPNRNPDKLRITFHGFFSGRIKPMLLAADAAAVAQVRARNMNRHPA